MYWLTGIAFKFDLNEDLAPRIPIALISVGFLVFFFREVRRQFGEAAGWYATAVLGTSAGWLAYSQVGVMDLPLAASFAACVLLCVDPDPRREVWAGVMLGAGVLAKGLVPVVLAIPLFAWLLWGRRWRALALVVIAGALTAAPWYVLCTMQNGRAFLVDFFWKHHFERFSTDVLQHQQPFWYYIPVVAGGLFPWTALFGILPGRNMAKDRRLVLFAGTAVFGFLFFSAAVNKLPGYVIPLLPFVALLLGCRMAELPSVKWWLAAVATCLALYPWIGRILPGALAMGLTRASLAPGLRGSRCCPRRS